MVLCAIKRLVGHAQEFARVLDGVAPRRDAKRNRGLKRLACRRAKLVVHQVGFDPLEDGRYSHTANQEAKLIAAEPSRKIAGSKFLTKQVREVDEDKVARLVAVSVIDGFKAVEICQDQNKGTGARPGRYKGGIEVTQKLPAI